MLKYEGKRINMNYDIENEVQMFIKSVNKSNVCDLKKDEYEELTKEILTSPNSIREEMDNLWWKFRSDLVQDSQEIVINQYRSPIQTKDNNQYLESKFGESYVYERSMPCCLLEENYLGQIDVHNDWVNEVVVFNSGMSCISNALSVLVSSFPRKISKLKMLVLAGYFETFELLNLYKHTLEINICNTQEELFIALTKENYDIVYIEPVTYSLDMEVLDLSDFLITAYKGLNKDKVRCFIFDTTLINNFNFPIGMIQELLSDMPHILLYFIQSLLKLNQLGLELSNGGVSLISCNKKYSKNLNFEQLINHTKRARGYYGQTPAANQLRMLENEFVCNKDLIREYTKKIFRNNAYVASQINKLPMFKRVVHPALFKSNEGSLNESPFILVELKSEYENDYFNLTGILDKKFKKDRLNICCGTSFGFQHSRFDVVLYDIITEKRFLRLSMGAYSTEEIPLIVNIFKYASGTLESKINHTN